MSPYVFLGVGVFLTCALISMIIFSYRSGRNAARVRSEKQAASDANQSTAASEEMLKARTNGIRSDNALLGSLDKGTY